MVDIHSHILHGLDDGASSLDESVEMVRMAAENGTTDIVATPHANIEFRFRPELVAERVAELRQAVGSLIQIHTGCDFHLLHDYTEDAVAHPAKYTINGKCYLMVELSDLMIFSNTDQIFQRLMDAGMIPVVTHPERNWLLQQRLPLLERWVSMGCCMQVTGQSLLGRFGSKARRFGEEMMERGLVHFIASDAHDSQDRTPRLDQAFQHVSRKYGEARAERLFRTNPRAALCGDPLPISTLDERQTPRRWFQFWS
ncbi:MAG: tyrosine-protein phosphatase [Bryobacteraceae bacterium]